MDVHETRGMLDHPGISHGSSVWVDLGCGSGTFTLALAELLSEDCIIHAVDRNAADLQKLPEKHHGVRIHTRHADFIMDDLHLTELDGILMANSLHYVQDVVHFFKKVSHIMKPEGKLLIVEYDTRQSNPWVPYPIPLEELKILLQTQRFSQIQKLKERPSVYNPAPMYSALVLR